MSTALDSYKSRVIGKNRAPVGVTPAVLLVNPKYGHNVGAAIRNASAYGARQVWWTGDRVQIDVAGRGRLPREERMIGYRDVDAINADYPFDAFGPEVVPVAVEVRDTSEQLPAFEHPDNAVYVFGPEDGSLPRVVLQRCHRFLFIPTHHCLNLGVAIGTILYDRLAKRQVAGLDPVRPNREYIGTPDDDPLTGALRDGKGTWDGSTSR